MDSEETNIYSAVLITCLVIGSIFFYFLYSLRRLQKHNLELQKRNSMAEITAMEKERSRIASDLHDDITPFLTAVKMKVWSIETLHEDDATSNQVIKDIDEILKRLREISFDLMPDALLRKGLITGIKELIAQVSKAHTIDIALVTNEELHMTEQKTINIFRVVQEILYNAARHSRATGIHIVFEKNGNMLTIRIADNGMGFDYDAQRGATAGFGLKSIQNRVELMGGQVFVKSQKGKGLKYVLEIPIEPVSP